MRSILFGIHATLHFLTASTDVDVTSPGVWDRESDVWYNELVLLDDEDDRHGIPPSISRPRSKGHLLTEHNLKLWLSMV